MTENSLIDLMYQHLKDVGLPRDVSIELRGYSNTYDGKYNRRIFIYHLEEDGTLRDIKELLRILRHEAIHHYQWKHDPNFQRITGVMHNLEFIRLEEYYKLKSERLEKIDV